jgi:hypothetical protein
MTAAGDGVQQERRMAVYYSRPDGLGARLLGLVGAMRVAAKLDADFFFDWPALPLKHAGGHYDVGYFFDPSFVAEHHPGRKFTSDQLASLLNEDFIRDHSVEEARQALRTRQAEGNADIFLEGWITSFKGESRKLVADEMRSLYRSLPFGRDIGSAVAAALEAFRRTVGGGRTLGIHVRLGDVTGGLSRVKWYPTKYLPLDYYRRAIERHQERFDRIILFSNDRNVGDVVGETSDKTIVSSEIFRGDGLNDVQLAMAELAMLGHCREIFAPAASAFSKASELFYGATMISVGSLFTGDEMFAELMNFRDDCLLYVEDYARIATAARLASIKRHKPALQELLPVIDRLQDEWIHETRLSTLYPRCLWRAGRKEEAIAAAEMVLPLGIALSPGLFACYARWIRDRDPERSAEIKTALAGLTR